MTSQSQNSAWGRSGWDHEMVNIGNNYGIQSKLKYVKLLVQRIGTFRQQRHYLNFTRPASIKISVLMAKIIMDDGRLSKLDFIEIVPIHPIMQRFLHSIR